MVELGKPVPRLIARKCGGWLAVSPSGIGLKIGVTADTESDALQVFEAAFSKWQEHLRSGQPAQTAGQHLD